MKSVPEDYIKTSIKDWIEEVVTKESRLWRLGRRKREKYGGGVDLQCSWIQPKDILIFVWAFKGGFHSCIHCHIHNHIHNRIHNCIHHWIRNRIHHCIHTCIHHCIHTCIHYCIHTCIHHCIHTCIYTCVINCWKRISWIPLLVFTFIYSTRIWRLF